MRLRKMAAATRKADRAMLGWAGWVWFAGCVIRDVSVAQASGAAQILIQNSKTVEIKRVRLRHNRRARPKPNPRKLSGNQYGFSSQDRPHSRRSSCRNAPDRPAD